MKRYGVRTLLVLEEFDKVQGILTASDILAKNPCAFSSLWAALMWTLSYVTS